MSSSLTRRHCTLEAAHGLRMCYHPLGFAIRHLHQSWSHLFLQAHISIDTPFPQDSRHPYLRFLCVVCVRGQCVLKIKFKGHLCWEKHPQVSARQGGNVFRLGHLENSAIEGGPSSPPSIRVGAAWGSRVEIGGARRQLLQ